NWLELSRLAGPYDVFTEQVAAEVGTVDMADTNSVNGTAAFVDEIEAAVQAVVSGRVGGTEPADSAHNGRESKFGHECVSFRLCSRRDDRRFVGRGAIEPCRPRSLMRRGMQAPDT